MMCFGADVSNAFGDARFLYSSDAAFEEWWIAKGRDPIPEGYVIPVLAAMQGHPESPCLWEKHIDKILPVRILVSSPQFMNHAFIVVRLMVNEFCLSDRSTTSCLALNR
jgi:hypothetical protein